MFKRRNKRSVVQSIGDIVYPRGGWSRAASYIAHRLRRLPDTPHKIARGVACGVWVCFTPFFGFHFVIACVLAWVVNGNIVAALLATFVGNPLTFPAIATVSLEFGVWLMDLPGGLPFPRIVEAFSGATTELWANFLAIFTNDVARWDGSRDFYHTIFIPYLLGGIAPGFLVAMVFYFLTTPTITAYQKRRRKKLRKRFEKMRVAEAAAEAAEKQAERTDGTD